MSTPKLFRCVAVWEVALVSLALSLHGLIIMNAHGTEFPKSLAGLKVYSAPAEAGSDLIGRRFEKWNVGEWINSKPVDFGVH